MTKLARYVVGSLLALAGCAEDPAGSDIERRTIGDGSPTKPHDRDSKSAGSECVGNEVDVPTLDGDLVFDTATGTAYVNVHNGRAEAVTIEVILHRRIRGELVQDVAPGIGVLPAGSGGVRIAIGDVNGDGVGAQLKAELIARDASGAVVERAFASTYVGPPLADVAASLRIPTTSKLGKETYTLGAIAKAGLGFDPGLGDDLPDDVVPGPTVPSQPLTYNMCFRWPVTLVDAGFGEDYGTNPASPWIARGGRVSILQGGANRFDGYLDANGCTGPFSATGTTDFSIFGYSRARVAGNDIVVRDSQGQQRSFVIWDADPGFNTNPVYVFPEVEAVSTLLAVSAYTTQKFHSGMAGKEISVQNRCRTSGNNCCNCAASDGIWVVDDDRKFLIAHEMGHRLLSLYMGAYNNDVSFDLLPGNATGTCDTTTAHSMWSLEFESGAAMEGWAHFIAVATFNSRAGDNPGAMMRYWSGTDGVDVDVEQGPTGGESNYMDDVCPGVAIATKLAVQLDWLRHYWDYYSNATQVDPGTRPSVQQMMSELDAAPAWSAGDAWTSMRSGVEATSGANQLARWDQMGAWNGID